MKAVRSAPPSVEVVEVPDPDSDDGVVTIVAAGICASDLMYIGWGSRSVLGHELAGIDRDGRAVAIEAIFGCGSCEWCQRGNFNLCPSMGERSLGVAVDGGMSQYFRAPTASLVPLPSGYDIREGCLVEPAAVAWHGARVGRVSPETSVAVVGGGAIGLLSVTASQRLGAGLIALEARHPHQIDAGERLGGVRTYGTFDVVIEAAGSESSLHRAIELVRPEGTVVVLGVYTPDVRFPYTEALLKEVRLVPAVGYCRHGGGRDFDEAAAMLGERPEIASTLITHRFALDDAPEAFRVAADKSSGAIRVVLEP